MYDLMSFSTPGAQRLMTSRTVSVPGPPMPCYIFATVRQHQLCKSTNTVLDGVGPSESLLDFRIRRELPLQLVRRAVVDTAGVVVPDPAGGIHHIHSDKLCYDAERIKLILVMLPPTASMANSKYGY